MPSAKPPQFSIRTGDDVRHFWSTLLGPGGFSRRTLWLALLDSEQRTLPVAVPIDDVPVEPAAGTCDGIAEIVHNLTDSGAATAALLLLSRPGSSAVTSGDLRWAQALDTALRRDRCPWPVHLATADGVQSLPLSGGMRAAS